MLALGLILLVGGILVKLFTYLSPSISWILIIIGAILTIYSFIGKKK